jgi:hypothetical protein
MKAVVPWCLGGEKFGLNVEHRMMNFEGVRFAHEVFPTFGIRHFRLWRIRYSTFCLAWNPEGPIGVYTGRAHATPNISPQSP